MDQDSCHYLLHPRGHHSVCHPGPHPVPRLLQVGARGPADAARAPGAALHLPAVPADPTAAPVHHALQPPLQTRGEEEKEVACSGSRTHHTCAAFGSSGTNVSLVLAAVALPRALAAARKNGIGWSARPCFDHTQLWQGPGQPGVGSVQGLSPRKMSFNPLMCNCEGTRTHTHTHTHSVTLCSSYCSSKVPFPKMTVWKPLK
ncbi:hypothetical protein RLOC_00010983 [Lonchura striata]|uniref:Uncharacterized protein n=1 Tax=Lonchura striata TaxID=40157 RepID=A0A218ULU0_9PASE|nr:hypothetical protein RLOC_00010983 [Lonchura striata domestica]